MKTRLNPFLRFSSILAAATALATSAQALDYTWEGTTGNWNDASWNDGTTSGLTGPTTAGNTATITNGPVWANVGVGGVDSITLGVGGQLGFWNGAYQYFGNLILQGGTLIGNASYNAYGASILGNANLIVSGSAASTISGDSWFNLGAPSMTLTVADVTGDANSDLIVSSGLRSPVGSPDYTYNDSNTLIKEGAGTLELAGATGGYGRLGGAITVNAGTISVTGGDGTGFGYQSGAKPTSLTINGATVTTPGTCHVWNWSGGLNMTGGTLQSNNGVSDANGPQLEWNYADVTTNASADTATIGGRIRIRADGGYSGISFNVAEGDADTDLLVSAAVTEASAGRSITKSGDGTMELSGANNYTGTTTVNGGTLVLSGAGNYSGALQVNAGTLSLSNAVIDDGASVVIANAATVNVNFVGSDTVGSLDIDGSGPLPAGTYSATTGGYESYFSGDGSLVVVAQDGTWTSSANGNWSDSGNWDGNIIAVGIDNTATFNAATGVTVTLDSNRIIGNLAFNLSNYTIDGGNTLTLDTDSTTPVINVATGLTATISAGLGGTDGMEKTGDGALVLSGVKSYTGGTTVTGGTLELNNSSNFDLSAINGSVTVQSGATLKLTGLDYTGLGRLGATVNYLEVNEGTVENTVQSWVTGATVNLTGGTMSGGLYHVISSGFNSFESDATSTISSNLLIRKDYGSADLSIDVADGTAATDLLISGNIGQVFAAGVVKNGLGTLILEGTNTYTGNTVVNDGVLEVTAASGLRFAPAGVATNSVSGTSTGTLSFLGTIDLDLGAADITDGNTWTLFDVGTLNSPTLTPFAITSTAGTFGKSGTTWTRTDGDNTWTFEETTGVLSLAIASGSDYDTWGEPYGLSAGSEGGDLDNDGVTNFEEYAFGLIPNTGASINPITAQLNKTTGKFSYTRREIGLQNPVLTYTVWYSTDLATWTQDTGASQSVTGTASEVDTVEVTLSTAPGDPLPAKLFIQVRAE